MCDRGPAFELSDARLRYARSSEEAVAGISCEIPEGRWTAVVGPNGAGKSTLLKLLSGVLPPSAGRVRFRGRELSEWGRRKLARELAVVAQEAPPRVPLTVREFTEMGRNPYLQPWAALSAGDRQAVEAALRSTELLPLVDRQLGELSGGELQRAKLARALAQAPSVILLDEPTAHLDLGHAVRFFELLRELIGRSDWTVICVTHDLNLASRYADLIMLLGGGELIRSGKPDEVLEPRALELTYGCAVRVEDLGTLGRLVVPLSAPDSRQGEARR
jgi:iron complex transport system ATP-binding protein